MARRNLDWHRRTEQRIAHWGGTVHTVAAAQRRVPGLQEEIHRNAGGYMREALGLNYAVLALTVGTGLMPFFVPPTSPGNTEALLTGSTTPVQLDMNLPDDTPSTVRRWLERPLRTRAIGPDYDAAHDDDAVVEAGPANEAINAILYWPTASGVSPLPE